MAYEKVSAASLFQPVACLARAFSQASLLAFAILASGPAGATQPTTSAQAAATAIGKSLATPLQEAKLAPLNATAKSSATDLQKGKLRLVLFWATWCGYCHNEMQQIKSLEPTLRSCDKVGGVHAISVDETAQEAQDKVSKQDYRFATYFEQNKDSLQRFLGFSVIPASYVVDGDGKIVFSGTGGSGARAAREEFLKRLGPSGCTGKKPAT